MIYTLVAEMMALYMTRQMYGMLLWLQLIWVIQMSRKLPMKRIPSLNIQTSTYASPFILPKKSFPKYTISYQHPEEGEEVGQETEYLAEDEANDDEVDGPPPAEDENANEVDDDDALYADVENAAELMAMGLPTSWMGIWALDDEEDEDEDQDDANEDQMNIDDDNDDEEEEEDGMVE